MPTPLAVSQKVYLPSLSMIALTSETLLFPVEVTGRFNFAAYLTV